MDLALLITELSGVPSAPYVALVMMGGTMEVRAGMERGEPGRDASFGRRAILLHATLALTLLAACGGRPEQAERDRPLVLGYAAELQSLNPLVSTDQNANELINYLLFTPLVTYDSTFRVRPWLAGAWELSDSAVVFDLRKDLRWHDGHPVTAEDVKFSFDRAVDPETASPLAAAYLRNVAAAEVLEPYRIRFRFTGPHAQPLEAFFWPPVPKHLLEAVPPAEMARHEFNRRPVGSGPYRFVSWQVNEQLVFEAAAEFPEELGGRAGIGRVIYRIVPEPTTRLAELLRGDLQVDGPLSPQDAAEVERATELELFTFPWRQFTYIGWNTRRELFREAAARRALALAIDRTGLLAGVLRGYGSLASGPIPPWHPYAPDLEPLPYAPDSARAILARLGWSDTDGDGVLDRHGQPFRFRLLTSQRNPIFSDLAQVIQAQLGRVGIELEPRLLEWQTVLGLHRARDFDAVLTNWVLDNFRIDPRPLFHGSQVEVEGSANRSSYANPRADSLMDLGVRTTAEAPAKEIWTELVRTLQRDQPLMFLFWNDELAGVRRELAGVRMDARGELATLPRWRWRAPDGEIARRDGATGAVSLGRAGPTSGRERGGG